MAVQWLQASWLLPIAHKPVPTQMLSHVSPTLFYTLYQSMTAEQTALYNVGANKV